jgi:hypothetical protein
MLREIKSEKEVVLMGKIKNFFRDSVKKPYVDKRGYELRYRPESPSANANGYAHTHRVVAEQKIGGAIYCGRVVHHRDGDKLNNSASNLQVMSMRQHNKLHKIKFRGSKVDK